MALVSLSADIEERRQAALDEIARIRGEIALASDLGPSDAAALHSRCLEILSAFRNLAEKLLLTPEEVHVRLGRTEMELRQTQEQAATLQAKLDSEHQRTASALREAQMLADSRYTELVSTSRRAINDAKVAKLTIADLKCQLASWRRVASGEILRYKPGPKTPQPGKPYRAPRSPKPKAPGTATRR